MKGIEIKTQKDPIRTLCRKTKHIVNRGYSSTQRGSHGQYPSSRVSPGPCIGMDGDLAWENTSQEKGEHANRHHSGRSPPLLQGTLPSLWLCILATSGFLSLGQAQYRQPDTVPAEVNLTTEPNQAASPHTCPDTPCVTPAFSWASRTQPREPQPVPALPPSPCASSPSACHPKPWCRYLILFLVAWLAKQFMLKANGCPHL